MCRGRSGGERKREIILHKGMKTSNESYLSRNCTYTYTAGVIGVSFNGGNLKLDKKQ